MTSRYAVRDLIETLDPVRDHWRVHRLTAQVEFPWDVTRALELALYRTFAVPSIAQVLDGTGEFRLRAQKRYDDTALLLAEVLENGYDSARGRAALSRINRIHARFPITQEDYRYVLGTFVFVPERWLDRWGWRPLTEVERESAFLYYRAVGARMGIRGVPADRAAFAREFDDYERAHLAPGVPQQRTATATRELFVSWFPRPLAPALRPSVHALLDPPLLESFGFPAPPSWLPVAADRALRTRAAALRHLPPRRRPASTAESRLIRSYPGGWRTEELGPT
ncbi:MAG TPA: oxygenase MpaB family protein [Mycobacteriales bacterium]|nr:oxygenase MpaB family protein [Mycobacteriales bacterium]